MIGSVRCSRGVHMRVIAVVALTCLVVLFAASSAGAQERRPDVLSALVLAGPEGVSGALDVAVPDGVVVRLGAGSFRSYYYHYGQQTAVSGGLGFRHTVGRFHVDGGVDLEWTEDLKDDWLDPENTRRSAPGLTRTFFDPRLRFGFGFGFGSRTAAVAEYSRSITGRAGAMAPNAQRFSAGLRFALSSACP